MISNEDSKKLKNLKKLNRKMHRRPFIRGVSGILRHLILDRLAGSRDAKQDQVCTGDGQAVTPNVIRMNGCMQGYMDKIYAYAVRLLTDIFAEAAALSSEIDNIRSRSAKEITATGEEGRRQLEAAMQRQHDDEERMEEIKIRAAVLREWFTSVDEAIRHHMEHAQEITKSHISRYWRGVLKTNAGAVSLPVYPVINGDDFKGLEAYESHMSGIGAMIENIMSDGKEV